MVVVGKIGGETLKELRAADFEEKIISLDARISGAQFQLEMLRKQGPDWVDTKESEEEEAALIDARAQVFIDRTMKNWERQDNVWSLIHAELGLKEDSDLRVDRFTGIVERVLD